MKKMVECIIFYVQYFLLKISYFIFYLLSSSSKQQKGWVVAGVETASLIKNISSALPNSISVNFAPNRFYDFKYDYEMYSNTLGKKIINIFLSPILLGYLMNKYHNFLYLGAEGFISKYKDGRGREFDFIKRKKKKLICYFCGSEIRSFKLMEKFSKENDMDVITTYQSISNKNINTEQNENKRMLLAKAADKYADFIFNPSVDQMSYFERKTHPFIYFLDKYYFSKNRDKYKQLENIIVVHAPSSPLIKGTPLVRAAIKKLKEEGYNFQYIELINRSNLDVLKILSSAHIVLNQFYAFVPGVLGIEAMAKSCALLTSADKKIETSLGEGANQAWVVTPYWLIYDKLKVFLDNPVLIESQAEAGYKWTLKNCSYEAGVKKINSIINN